MQERIVLAQGIIDSVRFNQFDYWSKYWEEKRRGVIADVSHVTKFNGYRK